MSIGFGSRSYWRKLTASLLLVGAGCGDSSPELTQSADKQETVDLSRFYDSTVVGGRSEFLVVGLSETSGGAAVLKMQLEGGAVTTTPEHELHTMSMVEEIDAHPLADQAWVVLMTGCVEDLDETGQCLDFGTNLVTVSQEGDVTEVGRVVTAGASAHVVGDVGDGHVVVRLGVSTAGTDDETAAAPTPISYEQTYALLNLSSAEITPLDNLSQSLVAPSVIADPSQAAHAPFLHSCASPKHLAVLTADDSVGTNLSLSVMDPFGGDPTVKAVELPDGWLPKALLCDGPEAHRLVMVGPNGDSTAVADLISEGTLTKILEASLEGMRIQGLQTGPTSVLVDAAPVADRQAPDGDGRRLFAFTGGDWRDLSATGLARSQVVVSDDGAALLIREATLLRVVEL